MVGASTLEAESRRCATMVYPRRTGYGRPPLRGVGRPPVGTASVGQMCGVAAARCYDGSSSCGEAHVHPLSPTANCGVHE